MDTNKILSADLLDLIFDDRNKDYGAYALRKTYQKRVTKALIFTGLFVALTCTGVVLANKLTPKEPLRYTIHDEVTITDLTEEKKQEPLPEPPRQEEPPQTRTEQFTTLNVVPDEIADKPIPPQEAFDSSQIGTTKIDGPADIGIESAAALTEGTEKGILEVKPKEPDIWEKVEVDAKFDGNWEKFLRLTLNAQTPVDNNAPPGLYKVVVQFVVDIDGSVSDIKALTNHGYGLEEEAMRAIKKSKNWQPAMQNGRQVKAYRKQPISFLVPEE